MTAGPSFTGSDTQTRVIAFKWSRLVVSDPARDWRGEVVEKLNELTALERGWDGYHAGPVKFDTAYFALQMLEQICPEDAPVPQIVPGSNGDLQFEWHTANGDVELHVRRPYDVLAWHSDAATGANGEELRLTNEFTAAAEWVRSVTEPALAVAAAA